MRLATLWDPPGVQPSRASHTLPRHCTVAATGGQRRAGGEHAPPLPAPTPPDQTPSSSRPPPGRARSAAAARMRRVKQQPAVKTPPSTAVQPLPPPSVLPEEEEDDDPSLYSIEPEVLPIHPADLVAALEGLSSGSGSGIGIFSGEGGEAGDDGGWEAGPPPLGDPALLVQAESSLVASTRPGDAGDAALAPAPGGTQTPAFTSESDPEEVLAGLTQEERDDRTDLIVALATAGAGFEDALAQAGPSLDGACLALLARRIRALKL